MNLIKRSLTEKEKVAIGETLLSPGFNLIVKCIENKMFFKYYETYNLMLNADRNDNLSPIKDIADDVKRYKYFLEIIKEIQNGDVYNIDFIKD